MCVIGKSGRKGRNDWNYWKKEFQIKLANGEFLPAQAPHKRLFNF
jgi:hypothetical protein